MRIQGVITCSNDSYLHMRLRDSRLSADTLLHSPALCTSCCPRRFMGTCIGTRQYWLSYLYVQKLHIKRHSGLYWIPAEPCSDSKVKLHHTIESQAASPVSELLQHSGLSLDHSCHLKPWEFILLKLSKQLCAEDRRWQNRVGGGGSNIWLGEYFEVSHWSYKSCVCLYLDECLLPPPYIWRFKV